VTLFNRLFESDDEIRKLERDSTKSQSDWNRAYRAKERSGLVKQFPARVNGKATEHPIDKPLHPSQIIASRPDIRGNDLVGARIPLIDRATKLDAAIIHKLPESDKEQTRRLRIAKLSERAVRQARMLRIRHASQQPVKSGSMDNKFDYDDERKYLNQIKDRLRSLRHEDDQERYKKERALDSIRGKAEKLYDKYRDDPSKLKLASKAIERAKSNWSEFDAKSKHDPEKSKRELFKTLVHKSDDFNNPLGRKKQRQFKSLINTATPKDMENFKKHSDKLASIRPREFENPHQDIKKVASDKYVISHPEHGDFSLEPDPYRTSSSKHTWKLLHKDTNDQAGTFEISPDKEVKWSNIFSKYRGQKLSPKVYTALAKHYKGIKSDPEVTLDTGRGTWMHLKRQGLHGVEPLKGKESKTLSTREADTAEGKTGDQRYSYKLPPEVKKNVEKYKSLRSKHGTH
jgi:hypothetical protein